MNDIKLSICIPTYKRPEYLARCLESIKLQLEKDARLNNDVQIVISDNCSDDNTEEVANRYQEKIKKLKYIKNKENIGFDLNVLNVVRKADGKYCWYLGDDDSLTNGGIEFVFDCLKDSKYDIVTVQATPIVNEKDFENKFNYSESSKVEVDDFNDFYFKGYCQGGFSVLIFERDLWLSCVDENNFLKHWLYYETILKMLTKTKKQMLYIKDPIIITGQDCRWAENGTEIFTFGNSNILMEKMIGFGFYKERLEKDLEENSKKLIIILLRAKGHGLKCNLENLRYIYNNIDRAGFWRLFLASLIYFIPNGLIIFLRDSRKKIVSSLKNGK